jgi:hypothetical protein
VDRLFFLCPSAQCCQHWNLKKVATDNYDMKLVEQDITAFCDKGLGLIPSTATKLYGPQAKQTSPNPGGNLATFRIFPVVLRLHYSQRLGDTVSELKFNKDFTGSLTRGPYHLSRKEKFTWKSEGKVVSLTSETDSDCTQKWTFYFNKKTYRHHIKLTKDAARDCAHATGLLHSVQDIGLEIPKPETSLREALTKLNYAFIVSYDRKPYGAISKLKFSWDGMGFATRSVPPPPGGHVPNFKWHLHNEKDLTMTSIEDPACTQVWRGSFSGTKVVLELIKSDANGCGRFKELLPAPYTTKVMLTPVED